MMMLPMTWMTPNWIIAIRVVWCVFTTLVYTHCQALTIGICTMAMVHGTTCMTRGILGIGTMAGATAGVGDLGTAGMAASGDGITHTHGHTGDGDQVGVFHMVGITIATRCLVS